MQTLARQGMAKESDMLTLRISRFDFEQKLVAAKANLADAMEQLKSLTGKDIEVPPAPTAEAELTLPGFRLENDRRYQCARNSAQRCSRQTESSSNPANIPP